MRTALASLVLLLLGACALFGPGEAEVAKSTRGLFAAIERGDDEAVQLRLEEGADVDARRLSSTGGPEFTPLQLAVTMGRHAAARELVAAGADVRASGPSTGTALHLAVLFSDLAMVKLLVRNGAVVDSLDYSDAQSPLELARRTGKASIEAYLLAEGAVDRSP